MTQPNRMPQPGLKPKDLVGLPWRLAFALQDDGWWLRSDIIWAKKNCLSGGSWFYVRSQKGDMPIMLKDLVRLNPSKVKLWNGEKWTRPLAWWQSTDQGEKFELVFRSGERVGCTAHHLWPTLRGDIAALDLKVGDVVKTCELPESDATRPTYLTDDSLWFIGLYLAEGSRSGDAIQLSLNANEQSWVPKIEAVAAHYGGTCTHNVDGNSLHVRVYGRILHSILAVYVGGHTSIDKHLTTAAWRLPNSDLRIVATGYLEGDGHDDKPNSRWRLGFCRNYSLERDIRVLAARLHATVTLKPSVSTYQDGERPSFRGEWRWERSGQLEREGPRRDRRDSSKSSPRVLGHCSRGRATHVCLSFRTVKP